MACRSILGLGNPGGTSHRGQGEVGIGGEEERRPQVSRAWAGTVLLVPAHYVLERPQGSEPPGLTSALPGGHRTGPVAPPTVTSPVTRPLPAPALGQPAASFPHHPACLCAKAAPPGLTNRGEEPRLTRGPLSPVGQRLNSRATCYHRRGHRPREGRRLPQPMWCLPANAGAREAPCSSLARGRGSSPQPQGLREGSGGPPLSGQGLRGPSTGLESAAPASGPHIH